MRHIVVLDPGIDKNGENIVPNLGDIVISRAINEILNEMFPSDIITRVPSHYGLSKKDIKLIKSADYTFVAGTNLISSNIKQLNRPLGPISMINFIKPQLKSVVLFGVGWGYGYGVKMTPLTKLYYKNILFSKKAVHSVRDQYSEGMLQTIIKVNNTNCPTLWKLNGRKLDLERPANKNIKCLFTLTDYLKDYDKDNSLLLYLLERFNNIVFFPQGKWDLQYLKLLPAYVNNKTHFTLLEHDINAYDKFVENEEFIYIGTRLHGGIRCLQASKPAYIITIDNRAQEIAKDTKLASGPRGDIKSLEKWLNGKSRFGELSLNLLGIDSFLNAYK